MPTKSPTQKKRALAPIQLFNGCIAVNTAFLLDDMADPQKVVREAVQELFSMRHQPEQTYTYGVDPRYPNTFQTISVGHDDCDDEKYELLERQNCHYEDTSEMEVLYGKEMAERFKASNGPRTIRVDMSLGRLVARMRAEQLGHECSGKYTERYLADVLYNQLPKIIGQDPASPYAKRSFSAEALAMLDDEADLQHPQDGYRINATSEPAARMHWDELFHEESSSRERARCYFEGLSHTTLEIVMHRLNLANELHKTAESQVGYPGVYRMRFRQQSGSDVTNTYTELLKQNMLLMQSWREVERRTKRLEKNQKKARDIRRLVTQKARRFQRDIDPAAPPVAILDVSADVPATPTADSTTSSASSDSGGH
jgi:hypothetical protein